MAFGPIISSSRLSINKIVRTENFSKGAWSYGIHGARLQIREDSSRNVTIITGLIEVDFNPFNLQIGISMILSRRVNAMFVRNDLPKFGTHLVSTLACLNVDNFTRHGSLFLSAWSGSMNTVNVVRKEYRVPPNPICHIKVNGRGVFWSVSASVLKVADNQYPMQYLPRLSNGNDNQFSKWLNHYQKCTILLCTYKVFDSFPNNSY